MAYKIIDVSRYQGTIDWDKVKADGVQGAFIRSVSTNKTGVYVDPTFERNYAECKRVGIPVGTYYFTYAQDKAYADKELSAFKNCVQGKSFELPLVVDVEDNSLKPLSADALTDIVIYALNTIESWGAYAMLYTYTSYENTELNMSRLATYDLWQADYRGENYKPAGVGMWQYTSSGKVAGIPTNCDMNWAYRDYPAIIIGKFNNFTGETVEPMPDVKPISSSAVRLCIGVITTGSDAKAVISKVEELGGDCEYDEGFIYTTPLSVGDQITVIKKAKEFGDIPVKEYVPIIITQQAGNITEPTPEEKIEQIIDKLDEEIEKPVAEETPVVEDTDNWLIKLIKFIVRLLKGEQQ